MQTTTRKLTFANEGRPLIWLALLSIFVIGHYVHPLASVLPASLYVMCLLRFRDPNRSIPAAPLAVVSPADGEVLELECDAHDPLLDRPAIRIRLKLSFFGVYAWRAPTEGRVMAFGCHNADASWIRTDEGDDVVIALVSGSLLGAAPVRQSIGQRVGQGLRCGNSRLAREIDVWLPASTQLRVGPGDRVWAGSSELARLVHLRKQ